MLKYLVYQIMEFVKIEFSEFQFEFERERLVRNVDAKNSNVMTLKDITIQNADP